MTLFKLPFWPEKRILCVCQLVRCRTEMDRLPFLHHQDRPTLDARGKALAKVRAPKQGHEQHSNHDKGLSDVAGLRCCPTRYDGERAREGYSSPSTGILVATPYTYQP